MPQIPAQAGATGRWGAAARYDFDNPSKWVTVSDVPLLDEHEMTDEQGNPVGYVGPDALKEIAGNNNRRVVETGDPATLILGHTSDDPRAPEKPAEGFVVNYKVKPFRRDPHTGRMLYAVFGDYKLRPTKADLPEKFPRRSVELWWNKKEIDPIAMLGGTTPERDLGVVIKKARINQVNLERTAPRADEPIRFGRRGGGVYELYRMNRDCPVNYQHQSGEDQDMPQIPDDGPDRYMQDDDAPPSDDYGDEDDVHEGNPDAEDPATAKIFQSRQWQELQAKLDMVLQFIEEQQGPPPPGPGDVGAGAPQGPEDQGPPPGEEPPMPPEGGEGGPDEQDARDEHGDEPVRFNSSGMPGPGSVNQPGLGGARGSKPLVKNYSRGSSVNNRRPVQDPDRIRMQRQVNDLRLKLARSEAKEIVNQLEAEGVLFGQTPEQHALGKDEELEYLALLGEEDRNYQVGVIRTRYARRQADPAQSRIPGAAQYARMPEGLPDGGDDFEPTTPAEANQLVDLELRGMKRADAIKYMRSRRGA